MQTTHRRFTWRAGQLLMALLFLLICSPIHLTHAATTASLGVQPLPAAHQRDKSVTYFDLLLGAGQTDTLQVKLTNSTDQAMKVAVKPATATSSDAGIVDYTGKSNPTDSSMTTRLSSLITGADTITVPAHGSATYAAKLTMPTAPFQGVLAGSLVFKPSGQAQNRTSGRMGIVNEYAYTVAVLARNSAKLLTPKLTAGSIKAGRIEHANRVSVTLHNQTAAFANHVRAVTTIKKPKGKTVTLTAKDAQLAPNSLLHQTTLLGDHVAAGDYRVHTVLYWGKAADGRYVSGGEHYQYTTATTKTVTITAAKARALSAQAKQDKGGMPMIYKLLIGIGIAIIILLIIVAILLIRHRRLRQAQVAALQAQVSELQSKSTKQD